MEHETVHMVIVEMIAPLIPDSVVEMVHWLVEKCVILVHEMEYISQIQPCRVSP